MCGIAGLFATDGTLDLGPVVGAMVEQMRHRGPDHQETRVWAGAGVALGHDRLSIVDLSEAGNQPLSNEDGTVWVVCNGEIYNHATLRRQLIERGHVFRSRSDSETLVHLYEEYGPELCDKLHGMFAFALYDTARNLVLCGRDRLGKKPLVYAETPRCVAIASEIPAIRRHVPGVDTTIDPLAIALYMLRNLRHIPDPWTVYRGMRRLPPGHAMVIREGRIERIWRYWRPDFHVRHHVTPEEILSRFDDAVDMRSVADVEVGALLSGGVDSSAIVERMVRGGGTGRVHTYALGRDKDDEELARARHVAATLGTQHKEFYFDAQSAHRDFLFLLQVYGEPIVLLPLLYALELFRQVRADGLKVVMTGHGADEIFYGYPGFRNMARFSTALALTPERGRVACADRLVRLPLPSAIHEACIVAAAAEGRRKAGLYRDEARRLWPELFDVRALDLREGAIDEWLSTWFEDGAPGAYIDESAVVSMMHENAHSVTIAGDLPAMATSVEVRCPFLDQDLVQLAWHTPFRQKVRMRSGDFQGKQILKQALHERLGRDVLYASKRGFGYHIREDDVLRGPWRPAVDAAFERLDGGATIFRKGAPARLKHEFEAGEVPAMTIAKIYALQEFLT